LADGVVIGSVLVEKMGQMEKNSADEIANAVGEIVGGIRRAI
jgi:tryptophan synthase alpha chain